MSIIVLTGLILGIVNGYISDYISDYIRGYIRGYISSYARGYARRYIISGDTVNVSGIDARLNDRMTYDSDGQRDKL